MNIRLLIRLFISMTVVTGFSITSATDKAALSPLSVEDARHLLTRTGFSPTDAEVKAILGKTRQAAVLDIINRSTTRATTPPPAWASEPIVRYNTLTTEDAKKAEREQQNRYGIALKAWWMTEMLQTTSPLTERMALFWHNHFATSQQKIRYSQPMYQQHLLLRENALGNFRTLLHAIGKDPAMLAYLDGANSKKESPNENFAREVMELFTLGEANSGGNYTEADIKNAARAFTGWSIERDDFSYRYRAPTHDMNAKTLFGKTGNFTGDEALDIILEQPHVAVYLTDKLWREFVSPQPDAAEVQRIAAQFRQSNYDIKIALRELLLSPAFWHEANRATLVKSPVELIVGTVRQFGFGYTDATPLALRTAGMGQNLFQPPNVKGWPGNMAWIDSTSLLDRKRFLEQLFRAIEQPDKAMQPMMNETSMKEVAEDSRMKGVRSALGREGLLKVAQAQANIWFDAEKWLAAYGGYIDREPSLSTKLAIQNALLPLPPANPTVSSTNAKDGVVGIAYLRQLVLDPVYQLK